MIRETYRVESIARERAIAHFINGVSGQSLVNAYRRSGFFKFPIRRVVSMGRRNTQLEPTLH